MHVDFIKKCLLAEQETDFHILLVDYLRTSNLDGLEAILQCQLSIAENAYNSCLLPEILSRQTKICLRDKNRLEIMLAKVTQTVRIAASLQIP